MKKTVIIIVILITGGLFSIFSFLYGSVEPDYGPPTGGELCKALSFRPAEYKEINYRRGFPVQKSGTVNYNVVCGDASSYAPSPGEIARSWQFYINWIIYTSLLTGLAFWLKNTRKH